jgi:hypothetical protein
MIGKGHATEVTTQVMACPLPKHSVGATSNGIFGVDILKNMTVLLFIVLSVYLVMFCWKAVVLTLELKYCSYIRREFRIMSQNHYCRHSGSVSELPNKIRERDLHL